VLYWGKYLHIVVSLAPHPHPPFVSSQMKRAQSAPPSGTKRFKGSLDDIVTSLDSLGNGNIQIGAGALGYLAASFIRVLQRCSDTQLTRLAKSLKNVSLPALQLRTDTESEVISVKVQCSYVCNLLEVLFGWNKTDIVTNLCGAKTCDAQRVLTCILFDSVNFGSYRSALKKMVHYKTLTTEEMFRILKRSSISLNKFDTIRKELLQLGYSIFPSRTSISTYQMSVYRTLRDRYKLKTTSDRLGVYLHPSPVIEQVFSHLLRLVDTETGNNLLPSDIDVTVSVDGRPIVNIFEILCTFGCSYKGQELTIGRERTFPLSLLKSEESRAMWIQYIVPIVRSLKSTLSSAGVSDLGYCLDMSMFWKAIDASFTCRCGCHSKEQMLNCSCDELHDFEDDISNDVVRNFHSCTLHEEIRMASRLLEYCNCITSGNNFLFSMFLVTVRKLRFMGSFSVKPRQTNNSMYKCSSVNGKQARIVLESSSEIITSCIPPTKNFAVDWTSEQIDTFIHQYRHKLNDFGLEGFPNANHSSHLERKADFVCRVQRALAFHQGSLTAQAISYWDGIKALLQIRSNGIPYYSELSEPEVEDYLNSVQSLCSSLLIKFDSINVVSNFFPYDHEILKHTVSTLRKHPYGLGGMSNKSTEDRNGRDQTVKRLMCFTGRPSTRCQLLPESVTASVEPTVEEESNELEEDDTNSDEEIFDDDDAPQSMENPLWTLTESLNLGLTEKGLMSGRCC